MTPDSQDRQELVVFGKQGEAVIAVEEVALHYQFGAGR